MALFVCTGNQGKIQEYRDYLGQSLPLVGLPEVESALGQPFPEPQEDFDIFLGNALLKLFSSVEFLARAEDSPCGVTEVLVDDSGLCVPALRLEPGVHSAYYGGLPRDAAKNRVALARAIRSAHSNKEGDQRLTAFFVCFLLTTKVSREFLAWVRAEGQVSRRFSLERAQRTEMQFMERAIAAGTSHHVTGEHHSLSLTLKELFPQVPAKLQDHPIMLHFGFCVGEVGTVEQNLIPGAGHGYDSMFYARQHPQLSFASISLEQKNDESHRALAMKALVSGRS